MSPFLKQLVWEDVAHQLCEAKRSNFWKLFEQMGFRTCSERRWKTSLLLHRCVQVRIWNGRFRLSDFLTSDQRAPLTVLGKMGWGETERDRARGSIWWDSGSIYPSLDNSIKWENKWKSPLGIGQGCVHTGLISNVYSAVLVCWRPTAVCLSLPNLRIHVRKIVALEKIFSLPGNNTLFASVFSCHLPLNARFVPSNLLGTWHYVMRAKAPWDMPLSPSGMSGRWNLGRWRVWDRNKALAELESRT